MELLMIGVLMRKVEGQGGCDSITALAKHGLETLEWSVGVNQVVAVVNQHPAVRRANPNVMPAIAVPELPEAFEQCIELGSRKLATLIAPRFTLAAWHDKHVKQKKRRCESER